MNRTRPSTLIILGAVGAIFGWLLELGLFATGRALLIPPFTLGLVLATIGALLVVLALPVFRVVRKVPGASVDPFYATRVVVLAKAASLAGAPTVGAALGIIGFILSRTMLPAVGSVSMSVVTVIGAIILLSASLVAERMCTLPPDDDGLNDTTTEHARP